MRHNSWGFDYQRLTSRQHKVLWQQPDLHLYCWQFNRTYSGVPTIKSAILFIQCISAHYAMQPLRANSMRYKELPDSFVPLPGRCLWSISRLYCVITQPSQQKSNLLLALPTHGLLLSFPGSEERGDNDVRKCISRFTNIIFCTVHFLGVLHERMSNTSLFSNKPSKLDGHSGCWGNTICWTITN